MMRTMTLGLMLACASPQKIGDRKSPQATTVATLPQCRGDYSLSEHEGYMYLEDGGTEPCREGFRENMGDHYPEVVNVPPRPK